MTNVINQNSDSATAPSEVIVLSELAEAPQDLKATINWLLNIGLPPLPECPIQAAEQGKQPKQPCYLGSNGIVYAVPWKPWQDKQPPKEVLDRWFRRHNKNGGTPGIGTLGKFNGQHWVTWVDIDAKTFTNNDCNERIAEWESQYPILKNCPMFRSPSGGYRYMIALAEEPQNFKANSGFSLSPDGSQHCGELLAKSGGHTLLPPTIGVNGAYTWVRWCKYPPVVQKPEDIGIYPLQKPNKPKEPQTQKIDDPKPTQTAIQAQPSGNSNDVNDLKTVIDEVNSRLNFETAFDWEGHDFQYDGNEKVKGNCPWHDSTSGTAFYAERKGSSLLWRCPACNIGGDVFGYRSLLKGGDIKPRGKEFIGVLKELCEETGVQFPERSEQRKKDYDPNRMRTTPDATVLNAFFEGGKGNFKTMNDAYYKYLGKGYWQHIEDARVQKWIGDKLLEIYQLKTIKNSDDNTTKEFKEFKYSNDRNKTSAFKFCRSVLLAEEKPYNDHLLCFLNGTVDLRTGEMIPHDREHFLTYAIASNYVPNAECPEVFKSFIKDAFGEEFLPLIRAVTAMYLDPTAPFGYFAHIIGSSGSGKGTLLRLWGSMFGETNLRSLTSFGDLISAEGRHQYLTGAKFVSFPDMGGHQGSLKAFYELVDNGSMTGRALYSSSSYERRWQCRFALASVDYLSVENSGDGWDRRCIPLPTRQRQGAIDPDLGRKLQEVKGEIISWALGMNRQKRDCLIMNASTASERIASLKREQSIYSDSTKAFVDLCLRPSSNPGAVVQNHQLYDWYCAFCKAHGFKAQSSTKFISHLRGVLPQNHVPRKQYREGGTVKNVPAHFAHLSQVSGAFNSTRLTNETLWLCNKAFCTDGGLDAFDEFWLTVTGVTGTTAPLLDMPVTPGSVAVVEVEGLSQVSQVSQGEFSIAKKIEPQTDSTTTGVDDKIGSNEQLEIDIRVNSPDSPCDGCDSENNIDTASIPAVTDTKNPPCDMPVTAVTGDEKYSTSEPLLFDEPKPILWDEAVEAVEILLEAPEPSWEAIKEALKLCGIFSYAQLQDKLTLGDYKKLDKLAEANDDAQIAF